MEHYRYQGRCKVREEGANSKSYQCSHIFFQIFTEQFLFHAVVISFHLHSFPQEQSASLFHTSGFGHATDYSTSVWGLVWLSFENKPQMTGSLPDTEFFILLPRAKICNLQASAKFLQFPPLFRMIFYVINA